MYVYIYINIYINIHVCVCIYIYIYIRIRMHIYLLTKNLINSLVESTLLPNRIACNIPTHIYPLFSLI